MTKQVMNKNNRLIVIFSLLALIALLSFFINNDSFLVSGKKLQIVKEENIPLREVSGATLFNKKGKNYLYTIGDASAEIYITEVDYDDKSFKEGYSINIKEKIIDRYSFCRSEKVEACRKSINSMTKQWEAIFVDPSEKIFMLNEPLATILVYDQKNQKISHTISLDSFFPNEDRANAPQDENSQGEGFLPLNNGHILVVKERKPAVIVEFGPENDQAQGFNKSFLINSDLSFRAEEESIKMKPLAFWRLPNKYSSCDLSELTHTQEGTLEILSQRCQAIFKIADLNSKDKEAKILESWSLPSSIKQAEAFVPLKNPGEFLVFEDKKSTLAKNVFFLGPQ